MPRWRAHRGWTEHTVTIGMWHYHLDEGENAMGLLDRFRQRPSQTHTADAIHLDGDRDVSVVGESHYQPALRELAATGPNIIAGLVPEPANRHDPNAIQVQVQAKVVGYLSREDAIRYLPLLRRYAKEGRIVACDGFIIGGREKGHHYGVILSLPEP